MYSSVSNGIVRQCTLVLKETLTYYVNNHSTVFCSFLDTSKAFDRVHYCKLLRLLIDRGMPPYIVRITMKSLCWTCNKGYVERYVFYFFTGLLFFLYLCFACRAKWVHSHQQDVEPEDRSESCHWTIFNNMHHRLLWCTTVLLSGPLCWTKWCETRWCC